MNWRYLLSWDWGQQSDLEAQRAEIDQLKHQLRAKPPGATLESEVERLRAENGELKLYVAVLFRLLEAKGIISRREVGELVERVDQEDGRRDDSYGGDVFPQRGA